jgi:hypothetical protein
LFGLSGTRGDEWRCDEGEEISKQSHSRRHTSIRTNRDADGRMRWAIVEIAESLRSDLLIIAWMTLTCAASYFGNGTALSGRKRFVGLQIDAACNAGGR